MHIVCGHIYMCVCMYMPMCYGELVRLEGSFVESILSCHLYLSSGDGTQVSWFVSKCFCLPNCLTGFFLIIFTCSLVLHVFVVSCEHHYHPLLRLFHFPELHLAQLSISPSQPLTPAILLSVDLATQEPHMSASAVFSFRDCIILPSTMSSNLSILLHVSELLPY